MGSKLVYLNFLYYIKTKRLILTRILFPFLNIKDKSSSEMPQPNQTILWRLILSEYSERISELSNIGIRILETGDLLSKSPEAVYAFQKLLSFVPPDERFVKTVLMSKCVDPLYILKMWIKKYKSSEDIIEIIQKTLKSVKSDQFKENIDSSIISIVNNILAIFEDLK